MTDTKRKSLDTPMCSSKKVKEETTQNTGVLFEDQIPDGMFHLGDSVFVFPSTYRGYTTVHIRRYKKYGSKYYPTREGVTLQPWVIPFVMQRTEVPQSSIDLQISPENHLKIERLNFQTFTFKQIKNPEEGQQFTKSVTIMGDQWKRMMNLYCDISTSVADEVYGSVDFLTTYQKIHNLPPDADLPSSLDVSLGQHYLTDILEKSVRKFLIQMSEGVLKEPETLDGETLGNRVETFNKVAWSQNVEELVHVFYDALWEEQNFLALRPHAYLTQDFLKNICLKKILQKTRKFLCPEFPTEYYENLD